MDAIDLNAVNSFLSGGLTAGGTWNKEGALIDTSKAGIHVPIDGYQAIVKLRNAIIFDFLEFRTTISSLARIVLQNTVINRENSFSYHTGNRRISGNKTLSSLNAEITTAVYGHMSFNICISGSVLLQSTVQGDNEYGFIIITNLANTGLGYYRLQGQRSDGTEMLINLTGSKQITCNLLLF